MKAIFLSASVPDPDRDLRYHATGDVVRIREAVDALVGFVLPRGLLVWGGHPAIAPFVRRVAARLGYADRVKTYQSAWFQGQEAEDTRALPDVVWTPCRATLDESLSLMREVMLTEYPLVAGVFIGGMEGVEAEYALFTGRFPARGAFPIASTGGAARILWGAHPQADTTVQGRIASNLVYDLLFEDLLAAPLA